MERNDKIKKFNFNAFFSSDDNTLNDRHKTRQDNQVNHDGSHDNRSVDDDENYYYSNDYNDVMYYDADYDADHDANQDNDKYSYDYYDNRDEDNQQYYYDDMIYGDDADDVYDDDYNSIDDNVAESRSNHFDMSR